VYDKYSKIITTQTTLLNSYKAQNNLNDSLIKMLSFDKSIDQSLKLKDLKSLINTVDSAKIYLPRVKTEIILEKNILPLPVFDLWSSYADKTSNFLDEARVATSTSAKITKDLTTLKKEYKDVSVEYQNQLKDWISINLEPVKNEINQSMSEIKSVCNDSFK
jgi:hypothetical protein